MNATEIASITAIAVSVIAAVGNIINTVVTNRLKKEHVEIKREVQKVIQKVENQTREIFILVLDDNEDDLFLVKRLLDKMGEKGEFFRKIDDLLARVPDESHIYIIDYYLVGMYGTYIEIEVKKRNKDNFVIRFTGMDDEENRKQDAHEADVVIFKNHKDTVKLLSNAIMEGKTKILKSEK